MFDIDSIQPNMLAWGLQMRRLGCVELPEALQIFVLYCEYFSTSDLYACLD